jgi:hypothetical protein
MATAATFAYSVMPIVVPDAAARLILVHELPWGQRPSRAQARRRSLEQGHNR